MGLAPTLSSSTANQRPKTGPLRLDALLARVNRWRDILVEGIGREKADVWNDNSRLNSYLNSVIVRMIWFKFCEVQGTLTQGTVLKWIQENQDNDQCRQVLKAVLQCHPQQDNKSKPHRPVDNKHLDKKPLDNALTIIDSAAIQTVFHQIIGLNLQPLLEQQHSSPGVAAGIILGHIYEYLISHPIEDNEQGDRTSGRYYTPIEIVDLMIEKTVKSQLEILPIDQITILDPACGAGIFLLVSYQQLLEKYRQQLGGRDLTFEKKKQILLRHIYGVDLDPQAVDVTRLALLLVLNDPLYLDRRLDRRSSNRSGFSPTDCLESCQSELRSVCTVADLIPLMSLLDRNIQWGNALVDEDSWQDDGCSAMQRVWPCHAFGDRLHPFYWQTAFPHIFPEGQAPSAATKADCGFHIVIGNPPYIDAESMSRYHAQERRYCAAHYATASGNWDLFCVFCERALQLCRVGGLSSFIVPNKLAAADYAQQTRHLLAVDNRLLYLRDYSAIPVFSIAVYPLVYVVKKETEPGKFLRSEKSVVQWERVASRLQNGQSQSGRTSQNGKALQPLGTSSIERRSLPYHYFSDSKRPWAIAPTPSLQTLMTRIRDRGMPLGHIAIVVGAATVAEAYALKTVIQERADLGDGHVLHSQATIPYFKFVNSGTIDRYRFLWNQKPVRYLKKRYQAPVIAIDQPFDPEHLISPKRWNQAQASKIVVAGMTLVLECAIDLAGEFFPGKSTTVIRVSPDSPYDLRYVLAILNSRLMSVYYRTEFGGNALNGGYLRIGPPQIKQLPICCGSEAQQAMLIERVDALLEAQTLLLELEASGLNTFFLSEEVEAIAHYIDQQVYQLYGLSTAEIAIFEED